MNSDTEVKKKPKVVRVADLRRVEFVFFGLGIVCSLIVACMAMLIFKVHLVTGKEMNYLKDLDKNFSKYYAMQEKIKESSIYEYDTENFDKYFAASVMTGLTDDKYAKYYDEAAKETFERGFEDYVGIGVGMSNVEGKVRVSTITPTGPAAEAGMKEGDIVIEVNGKKVKNTGEVEEQLEGKPGKEVKIKATRGDETKEFKVILSKIEVKTVEYKVLDKDKKIGYVRITAFANGTTNDFKKAVKDLKNQGCEKLVIDIRDNAGGVTSEGIKIADELLPACKLTTEVYKNDKKVNKSKQSSIGMKYVLLVNEKSASCSEVLASCIKANKGGKIIGTTTFGKGLIQTATVMSDGTMFKFTAGEFFAPDGSKINEVGVKPDIEAKGDDVMKEAIKALS